MKITLLLILISLSGVTARAQAAFTQPIDATDCTKIFFKALLEEDSKSLDNLLSTDFSITSFDGKPVDRNLLLQAIGQGYITIESGMLSATNTRNYGEVGVVTGNWTAKGQVQNNSFSNDLAYMVVCVKSGGTWKVSAVQFTPVR
jgi:hypothetical protein